MDQKFARETYCLQVLWTTNLQHVQLKHPNLLDHQEHLLTGLPHQTLKDIKLEVMKFIKTNLFLDLNPKELPLSMNAIQYSMNYMKHRKNARFYYQ